MATQNLVNLSELYSLPPNGGYSSYPNESRLIPDSWLQSNNTPYNITGWSFNTQYATFDLDNDGGVTAVTPFASGAGLTYTVVSAITGLANLYVPGSILQAPATANTGNGITRLVVIRIIASFTTAGSVETRNSYVAFRVYSDTPSAV